MVNEPQFAYVRVRELSRIDAVNDCYTCIQAIYRVAYYIMMYDL
jgi:hypothetical protein